MSANNFSLILLSTNQCNAACDYCFEDKTRDRLNLDQLELIAHKTLDYLDEHHLEALTLHWQGGEAMLLSPGWYQEANRRIRRAADARGKVVNHGLQTNLLNYSPAWNQVIAEMFDNTLSTSIDYPNLYRRLPGRSPAEYTALWKRKLEQAREAGIDVKVISVLNQGTLDLGGERYYQYLADELGVTDFQVNTPFPGGETNGVKQNLPLAVDELARFHLELAEVWLERGLHQGIRVGPFDELLDYFHHRDTCLPCIWGQNCAEQIVAIDARGYVAQCDCWVTSYPDYCYGNIFECDSLAELLRASPARAKFHARPIALVQRDCISCDHLALCHGGCPVRTFSVHGTLFEKDPYCGLYKTLFAHMQQATTRQAAGATTAANARTTHS